jgi:asparagine synthase (glutamine-hydrolysing)
MNSAVYHRGPDATGYWQDKNSGIVLGHQRLSILDLSSAGNQPMQSNSGQFVMTYNGEIYNHLEVRRELDMMESKIKWRGKSDTETLIESINFWGIKKTLEKIEGMFAFGIWNKKKRSLILARDRIGEKPLYFGWQGNSINQVFLFGSELKGLKVHPEFRGEINRNSIALQLRHNCIPAPHSIYKDIYKLLPGHYLELNEHDLKKGLLPQQKKYWSIQNTVIDGNKNQIQLKEKKIQDDLEMNLNQSVKKQMISDVPIGAFLSGGVDSSTIVALMQLQSSRPIKTYTIGFEESDYSEAKYAKKISQHIGTDHTEHYISSKKAMDIIPKLPTIYDEPFSDSSQIPTFLISQLSKQNVKVALSGDGGDELFCGYNRYLVSRKFSSIFHFIPFHLRKVFSFAIKLISEKNWNKLSKIIPKLNHYNNFGEKVYKGANALEAKTIDDIYYILCSHWKNLNGVVINSNEPKTLITELQSELSCLNNQQKMMVLDLESYLPNDILVKVDRAAMASSLETRAPFLDHKLIEYVSKIPHSMKYRNNQGKWILRQILYKYVPKHLIERPKMGFGVPIEKWLRGPLKDWAEDLLSEKKLQEDGYLDSKLIKFKWKEHLSGKRNWQSDLWDILMFQAWMKLESKKN